MAIAIAGVVGPPIGNLELDLTEVFSPMPLSSWMSRPEGVLSMVHPNSSSCGWPGDTDQYIDGHVSSRHGGE